MDAAVLATVVGLIAGVGGTGLGGVLALVFRRPGPSAVSVLLGLAAGVMLALTGFSLMPESFEAAGLVPGMAGFVLGVGLLFLADLYLPHFHFHSPGRPDPGRGQFLLHASEGSEAVAPGFVRAGILVGLGVAMHNLPEGVAIGAGYAHRELVGAGLAFAIALHNVPEGLAMALPMLAGGLGAGRIAAACALAGLPQALGALGGASLAAVSPLFLALSLGTAAGAMLYVTADELIPAASRLSRGHSATVGLVLGMVVGVFLSRAVSG
ncbi:MAG: ZIP family metal transporter [Acetobacteraceae bacterium]|nr:ZIP family metal transporter [Acetobacteraceae bacterium]